MKEFKRYFLVTLLAAFGLFLNLPVSAEICNRIVAFVNDDVITLHELDQKIRGLTGMSSADLEKQDREGYVEARRKVLDLLIDEKIAQDKIKELGIEVASKEVDSAIESIKERNHWTHEDLIASLTSKGVNFEQYRENIKNELEQMRLVNFEVKSKIIIRDETIKKYYDDHIDAFRSEEERVRLALIFLVQEDQLSQNGRSSLSRKAEEITSMLKNGGDFGALAKSYSQGPGRENGGDLGFIKTSQLDPKLKEIVNNMAVGDVSEPIINPSGIQIIKVIEKREKGVQAVEEVKDAIYNILYQKEISERYSSWINGLKEKAYVKIVF